MSRRITMLMAVLGTFAAIGVGSASAMDDVTKQDPPVPQTSSDGGTGSTPVATSSGIVSTSLGGTIVFDTYKLPNGQTSTRCKKVGKDGGTPCTQ